MAPLPVTVANEGFFLGGIPYKPKNITILVVTATGRGDQIQCIGCIFRRMASKLQDFCHPSLLPPEASAMVRPRLPMTRAICARGTSTISWWWLGSVDSETKGWEILWNILECNKSGQITINPKPESRAFGGDSLTKPLFKVTSSEVAIICHKCILHPLSSHA